MLSLFRPWQLALGAFLVAAPLPALAMPGRTHVQAEAVVVLASTLRTPVLSWTVDALTAEPFVVENVLEGAPTTVARPAGEGPWPALLIVNGATPLGREHPDLQRLVRGLARAGFLVVLPDLPGLRDGAISEATLAATVAVARRTADDPRAAWGLVGLVGVSVGTSLALLAAEDPTLAGRVSLVSGTAPFADLTNVIRLGTTGFYRQGDVLRPFPTDPFLAVAVARSVASSLSAGPDRELLGAFLNRLDEDAADPLAPLRRVPVEGLSPDVRAVVNLLANRDPRSFDRLFAALPASVRAAIERLSPLTGAHRLSMPVELASAPRDKYFPLAESEALARAAPRGRVTVTEALGHAELEPSLGELGDFVRLDGWVVRSLSAASAGGP
jgi:pimeloyl-ACP methyl ester carboxylesterase